jgi:hypothetical protein
MKSPRLRLSARMAALEAFREERLRQHLAVAHQDAAAARERQTVAEQDRNGIEHHRSTLLDAHHADMGRYALYGELAFAAEQRVGQAAVAAVQSEQKVDQTSQAWKEGQARNESMHERAERLMREAIHVDRQKQHADSMDLWLGRRRYRK